MEDKLKKEFAEARQIRKDYADGMTIEDIVEKYDWGVAFVVRTLQNKIYRDKKYKPKGKIQ